MKIIDKLVSDFELNRPTSARQQVARHLRDMIRSKKIESGIKLPSNKELAEKFQVSGSSVHAAMTVLVKEGLLERTPKLGTFVSNRTEKLTQVGIYLSEDIWRMPASAFRRTLVSLVSQRLRDEEIMIDIWINSRPKAAHENPWPELVRAAEQRRFQALLWLDELPHWVERLPIPVVGLTFEPTPSCVTLDVDAPERLAAQELARMGCRSAGLIIPSKDHPQHHDGREHAYGHVTDVFRETARGLGMKECETWCLHPSEFTNECTVFEDKSEHFGYQAMKRMLAMPDRPEGIFVTHDLVSRGALTAVLESKVIVPDELKLVFHRNIEIGFLCPIPVSFLDFSIARLAESMVDLIHARLRGEEVGPVLIKPNITSMR